MEVYRAGSTLGLHGKCETSSGETLLAVVCMQSVAVGISKGIDSALGSQQGGAVHVR